MVIIVVIYHIYAPNWVSFSSFIQEASWLWKDSKLKSLPRKRTDEENGGKNPDNVESHGQHSPIWCIFLQPATTQYRSHNSRQYQQNSNQWGDDIIWIPQIFCHHVTTHHYVDDVSQQADQHRYRVQENGTGALFHHYTQFISEFTFHKPINCVLHRETCSRPPLD